MARTPYASLLLRLMDIHEEVAEFDGTCNKCREPIPCDTMRAVWIYSLETQQFGGVI